MKQKLITLAAHSAAWLLFFSLVLGFVHRFTDTTQLVRIIFSMPFLFFVSIYLLVYYANTQVLIPWLYLRKRYVAYIASVGVFFITVALTRPFDQLMRTVRPGTQQAGAFRTPGNEPPPLPPGERRMPPPPEAGEPPRHREPMRPGMRAAERESRTDILSIVVFIAVWSLGTATCIIKQWRQSEQRAAQAEADKANAELSFLKAQINPHFLFNTLNNIYSLAITHSEQTAAGILKLSNIMRYVTDEVSQDYVPLEDELSCISDYIDLQKMRLGSKTKVAFSITGNAGDKQITPLLWMTFVENAFKYGVSNHEPAVITIHIQIMPDEVRFICENAIFERQTTDNRKGLGITNARQRLAHLYPGRHQLEIHRENKVFRVQLVLWNRPH